MHPDTITRCGSLRPRRTPVAAACFCALGLGGVIGCEGPPDDGPPVASPRHDADPECPSWAREPSGPECPPGHYCQSLTNGRVCHAPAVERARCSETGTIVPADDVFGTECPHGSAPWGVVSADDETALCCTAPDQCRYRSSNFDPFNSVLVPFAPELCWDDTDCEAEAPWLDGLDAVEGLFECSPRPDTGLPYPLPDAIRLEGCGLVSWLWADGTDRIWVYSAESGQLVGKQARANAYGLPSPCTGEFFHTGPENGWCTEDVVVLDCFRNEPLPGADDTDDDEGCRQGGAESCDQPPTDCPLWATIIQSASSGIYDIDPQQCPEGYACWLHAEGLWCMAAVMSAEACESVGTVLPGALGRAELHRRGCGSMSAVGEVEWEDGVALCCADRCDWSGHAVLPTEIVCRAGCTPTLAERDLPAHRCEHEQDGSWLYSRTSGCGVVVWRDGDHVEVYDEASGALVGVETDRVSGPYRPNCGWMSVRAGERPPDACGSEIVQYCR